MTRKSDVDDFLAQKKLAVVGVSRTRSKFGNVIFRELKKRDYQVFPVNANAPTVEDEPCYPDLKSLPESVDGAVLVIPPEKTEQVVKDASEAGIPRIWMQLGAQSEAAIAFCKKNNMTVISRECILMFAEPVTILHKLHQWVWKLLGKLPK